MFKIDSSDPRVTRVGRILGTYSLDEFPQLFNVLRADERSSARGRSSRTRSPRQRLARKRLQLKPGMTGLWQVLGRDGIPFEEMVQLDYRYVTYWSVTTDLKLIARTFRASPAAARLGRQRSSCRTARGDTVAPTATGSRSSSSSTMSQDSPAARSRSRGWYRRSHRTSTSTWCSARRTLVERLRLAGIETEVMPLPTRVRDVGGTRSVRWASISWPRHGWRHTQEVLVRRLRELEAASSTRTRSRRRSTAAWPAYRARTRGLACAIASLDYLPPAAVRLVRLASRLFRAR